MSLQLYLKCSILLLMKIGKKPPVIPANTLLYRDKIVNPVFPAQFDGTRGLKTFPVWGNDSIGDCTIAAAFNREFISIDGKPVYDATEAVETYSAITGYSPAQPSTDQGAVCSNVLDHLKFVGFPMSAISNAPKFQINDFYHIPPADIEGIKHCIAQNGSCYAGIQFPSTFYQQFADGVLFVQPDAQIEGGHCILLTGYTESVFLVVTWGKVVAMTLDFWQTYGDEAWALE